jgi:2-polyprenyl-6-methoxyphenol hydroxylase-like FAD-dependent oxidoreductase
MEDGCVLAAALASMPEDLPGGLELYERSRRPRASRVVLAARARGADNHIASPLAAWRRDLMMAVRRRVGPDEEGRGAGWIWDYDAGSPSALIA